MSEIWREIAGFEGFYEVSDLGRVRSVDRTLACGRRHGRVLRPYRNNKGYYIVSLWRDGRGAKYLVHRLVLIAFSESSQPGLDAAHNNGICTDNRLSNLRWATRRENVADMIAHGTAPRGERCGSAKLTAAQVISIRTESGSQRDIAARYGVDQSMISHIKRGKNWAWLNGG